MGGALVTITPYDRPRTVNLERVNGYRCRDCGRVTWTLDVHEGVTPMFLGCRAFTGCLGMAESMFYRVPIDHPDPGWEWYKPSKGAARRQEKRFPGSMRHWEQGGLSLRHRKKDPESPASNRATSRGSL